MLIVKIHAEIDLVDDLQQIDLKLHGGEQRTLDDHGQLPVRAQIRGHILPDGMPQAQEFHIVTLDEADGTQIVQLLPGKAKGAQEIDLAVDLRQHLRGKADALIAALEVVFAVEIGMLVENDLIHIEFIQVGIQQGKDNGFEFHG